MDIYGYVIPHHAIVSSRFKALFVDNIQGNKEDFLGTTCPMVSLLTASKGMQGKGTISIRRFLRNELLGVQFSNDK